MESNAGRQNITRLPNSIYKNYYWGEIIWLVLYGPYTWIKYINDEASSLKTVWGANKGLCRYDSVLNYGFICFQITAPENLR